MPLPDQPHPGTVPDPLEDGPGFAEVIAAAPVRQLARRELDGHVSLGSRELHELGATTAGIGWRDAPAAVLGRLQVVAGVLIGCFGIAGALIPTLTPLFTALGAPFADPDPSDSELDVAVGAAFAACALGGAELARRGLRRIRSGLEARRIADGDPAVAAADDPRARPTVALLAGPHEQVASLLWVRGDPDDPARVELRTLGERRLDPDDVAGAEDAVVELAEVALRAEAARGLPGPDRRTSAPDADRLRTIVAAARDVLPAADPTLPVPVDWEPDPLEDDGRSELAARLVRSSPLLWSSAVLERLAVEPGPPTNRPPAEWPDDAERRATTSANLPAELRQKLLWGGGRGRDRVVHRRGERGRQR